MKLRSRVAKRIGMQRMPRVRLREKFRVERAERNRPRVRRERDFVRLCCAAGKGGRRGVIRVGRTRRKEALARLDEGSCYVINASQLRSVGVVRRASELTE